MDTFRLEVQDLQRRITGKLTLALGDNTATSPEPSRCVRTMMESLVSAHKGGSSRTHRGIGKLAVVGK